MPPQNGSEQVKDNNGAWVSYYKTIVLFEKNANLYLQKTLNYENKPEFTFSITEENYYTDRKGMYFFFMLDHFMTPNRLSDQLFNVSSINQSFWYSILKFLISSSSFRLMTWIFTKMIDIWIHSFFLSTCLWNCGMSCSTCEQTKTVHMWTDKNSPLSRTLLYLKNKPCAQRKT